MRVYIAGPFNERQAALDVKERLERLGHVVTSRWVTEHNTQYDDLSKSQLTDEGTADLEDIVSSNAMVFLNMFPPTPGRWFEFGFATAMNMPVYVIGTETLSVFLHLPNVAVREDFGKFDWDFGGFSEAERLEAAVRARTYATRTGVPLSVVPGGLGTDGHLGAVEPDALDTIGDAYNNGGLFYRRDEGTEAGPGIDSGSPSVGGSE